MKMYVVETTRLGSRTNITKKVIFNNTGIKNKKYSQTGICLQRL